MNILQVLLIIFVVVFLIYYLLSNKERFNSDSTPFPSSSWGMNNGRATYCCNYNGTTVCRQGLGSYENGESGLTGYGPYGYTNCENGSCNDCSLLERRTQQFKRGSPYILSLETELPQIDYGVNIVD